ncbi:MAG: peptidylprolyl isomerase [bacterium]
MEKRTDIHWIAGRLLICFVMALAVFMCSRTGSGEVGMVDGVVAVVGDRNVLYSDVARSAVGEYRRLAKTYSGQELQTRADEVYRKTLLSIVERYIILATHENPGPEAVDKMVDAQLEEIVQSSFKGDRSGFIEALATEHVALQDWRNEIRDNILVSMFKRNEVDSKVLFSPTAVRREYDANRDKYKEAYSTQLRTIAIARGETDADVARGRQRAEEIQKQAVAGKDFESLQKDASPDGKADEPGWVGPGDLRPEIDKVVSGVKAGGISPVVEAGDSFLVIKVEARRTEKAISFAEARGELERQVRQKEQLRLYNLWMERLRKQVYVKLIQPEMVRK